MKAPTFAGAIFLTLLLAAYPVACSSSNPGGAPSDGGADVTTVGDGNDVTPEGDSGPSDPTIITEGLTLATALTVVDSASKLYWVENAGGATSTVQNAIRSVPTAGGTPSLVLTPALGSVVGALASDGTSLYYSTQESTPDTDGSLASTVQVQLMKSGLDGSSPTVLASGTPNASVTALFVANGTLFAQIGTGISFVATSATGETMQTLHLPGQVQGLYWADSTGLYYAVGGGVSPFPAPAGLDFYASPLTGSSWNLLVNLSTASGPNGAFVLAGVAVAGGNLYVAGGSNGTSTILAAPTGEPADGGAATTLATLDNWLIGSMVADANGMYATQTGLSSTAPAGIYAVSLTSGATTLFRQDTLEPYALTMDAKDVYWLDDVTTTTQALHALAR
jgi:hypothetical protein